MDQLHKGLRKLRAMIRIDMDHHAKVGNANGIKHAGLMQAEVENLLTYIDGVKKDAMAKVPKV